MKKLSPSRLADTVARLRREKSMTQAQLADATGINRALISRIEQHDFVPSIEQLEHLGEVLAFDITELFTNSCSENLASPAPMNIAVAGTGYVGLSIATLLAQHNHVTAVDIIPEKVEQINNRISPIQDEYIEKYLAEKKLDLSATLDGETAYKNADFVVIAAPTNYDSQKNYFDTSAVEAVGADSDTSLLEKLAEGCGGRYYYSDISTDIPKIFAREVFLSGETYLQNGTFTLSVNSSNAVTRGLFADGWPQISGYVSATPKSNANVLLASDKDDPVLSVMQYGLGHTVAWNTDVTNKWTKAYAGAEDYVQLWKRIVDYSVGNTSEGDTIDVSTANGTTTVTYHASEYNEKTKVEAVYTDPDGKTQTAKLQGSAPGVYEAKIDTDMTGIYNLSVRRMNKDTVENALTAAAVVQYSDEYKFALTNEKFKAFVKKYGKTITANDSLWKKLKASAKAKYDLTRWLLILAILWFVLDVAFRRFSFVPTDTKLYAFIKKHWTQKKNRAILSTKTKDVPKTEQPSEEEIPQQKKEKPKKAPKEKKKKSKEQQLDTSVLLKKKEQRHQ